jgi:hypothetical protein
MSTENSPGGAALRAELQAELDALKDAGTY